MYFEVVTLFPEMFGVLSQGGIVKRALDRNIIRLGMHNPRDFTTDRHRTVDDRPYGGGPGMVMKVEPLRQAIRAAKQKHAKTHTLYLSPQGSPLTQACVNRLSEKTGLILVSGRYEGIDERVIEQDIDEEISIGDYVLSGGELPAMVLIDAITRMLPDSLGDKESALQDSFSEGLLDCPHYTRPEIISNAGGKQSVPDILLSGNHQAIARWRRQQALGKTWQKRPDLLNGRVLSDEDQCLLQTYIKALPKGGKPE